MISTAGTAPSAVKLFGVARRVLITGARAAAALDVARDFAAAGWEPHLADCVSVRMARWSKTPARIHHYPSPRKNGDAFRKAILDMVETFDFELIVPTCEEVFHLAAPILQAQLKHRLFASNLATLRRLHDKLAFANDCAEWGLSVPESHMISSAIELSRFESQSCDWVFKPRYSRFGDNALIGPEPDALAKIKPDADKPWMVQARVIGEEACFHAIAYKGRLVAFAAYGSDWRLSGGARYAFEPISDQRNTALRDIAERLALHANIHGQFACDVMFDEMNTPFLLECNPRATSGVHMLAGAGDLARAISDGIASPQTKSRIFYLAPAMFVFGFSHALRCGKLPAWQQCLVAGSDVISRPGDRWPFVGALVDAVSFTWTGLARNISTNAATTFDLEWNGEELP